MTKFINLPSLHGWQTLPERRPQSQGKQLAGSCLPAGQGPGQWAWGGGLAALGKPKNMLGLAEANGSWWAQQATELSP